MKLKKVKQRQILEQVEITDAAAEGNCIARVDDMVVFVPYVVPGDVVDLEVYRKKKNYAQARVLKFHSFSDRRVEPLCDYFTRCGGCKWQTMLYSEQLRYKEKQVRDNLERIGRVDCSEMLPILPSELTEKYRNKLEFTFSTKAWSKDYDKDAQLQNALGFHVPGFFDKVIDINYCALQREPSNQIRNFIREYASEHGLPYYDIRGHEGLLRNLVIRTTSDEDLMVILVFAMDSEEILPLMKAVERRFPQITSLMYCINTKFNDSLSDQDILLFSGRDYITEYMNRYRQEGRLQFRIGPKTFYQTNAKQAERLYEVAADFAGIGRGDVVYDLYTGTGTIANYVAHLAEKVVGIEYVAEAVEDAVKNSACNKIGNTSFHAGDMAKVLTEEFVRNNGRPDVVITDPPRAGMAESVVRKLLEFAPRKIVYISCNPATQARDLSLLKERYDTGRIRPVDMFPHTQHVENVVELNLR